MEEKKLGKAKNTIAKKSTVEKSTVEKSTAKKSSAKKPSAEKTSNIVEQKIPYCQYKYTFEDNLAGAMFVYKMNQGRGKKLTLWALLVGFACSIFLIVMDIMEKNTGSLIFDAVLFGFLIILTVFIFVMPSIVKSQQKKLYDSALLDEMDYVKIDIERDKITQDFVKNDVSVNKIQHPLTNLTGMYYDETRIILVFGKMNLVVIKNDALKNTTVDEVKTNMLIQLDINKQSNFQTKTPTQSI